MKKNLLRVMAVFAFALCSTFALAGCFGGAKLTSIDLTQTFKTQYEIGETLDVSNGIIKATYDDDTQKDLFVTNSMVSGFNTQTTGQKTMIITYKGVTKTVSYTVTGPSLKEERYLWYNNNVDADRTYFLYIHKQSGVYMINEGTVSKNIDMTTVWTRLKDPDYLEDIGMGDAPMTIELSTTDYYYYASFRHGESASYPVYLFKIQSLDNFVDVNNPGVNMLEGYTRYIPVV